MSGIDREFTLETRTSFSDKHFPGAQKSETEWEFAEIWADTLISPPYILMLVKEKSGKFCIHNPAQNYKVIFASDSYESAKMWLLEDEYERLNSRILQEV